MFDRPVGLEQCTVRLYSILCASMHADAVFGALVRSALAVDGRNFHAWNYRQFMVKLLDLTTEGELAYSTSLIAGQGSSRRDVFVQGVCSPAVANI